MKGLIYFVIIIVAICVLMLANYAPLILNLHRYKAPKLDPKNDRKVLTAPLDPALKLGSWLPFVRPALVTDIIGGPSWLLRILGGVEAFLVLTNLIVSYILPINSYVMLFAHIGFILAVIASYVTYGIVTAYTTYLYGGTKLNIVLCALFPHFCSGVVGKAIKHHTYSTLVAKRFNAEADDTIIKSR